jgi:FkbM family methyltransferase
MSDHTPIPPAELELFKKLPSLKVIFDVGARADCDYLDLKPKAECHLFEPNHLFFDELKQNVGKRKAYLNNFGLSNKSGYLFYNQGIQTVEGSEAWAGNGDMRVKVKTLDSYAKDIPQIDFLKIDTEGNDYKVLLGGRKTIQRTRFIQYEHWNDKEEFHKLLEPLFHLEYVGYRNVLCINTKLVSKQTKERLIKFIRDNEYSKLA